MLPSQEILNEYFRYDQETGKLYWKKKSARKIIVGDEAGNLKPHGYIYIKFLGKDYRAHRIIYRMVYGDFNESLQIDHINGIRNDNRLVNLRLVTHQENSKNMSLSFRNTSGEIGIYWYKKYNKWRVNIKVNGKNKHIGYFTDFEEAIKARDKAYKEYDFHLNHGRSKVSV